MSVEKPDFETIKSRIRNEEISFISREAIRTQLKGLIMEFGQGTEVLHTTESISVDDEGTLIFAQSKLDPEEPEHHVIALNIPSNHGSVIQPIYEVRGNEVVNHKGETIRGVEITEVKSIINFMKDKLTELKEIKASA